MPSLTEHSVGGVTLLGDPASRGSVAFAFTERGGGASAAPYASLNLGASCGDDPAAVAENRRRALAALGAEDLLPKLVNPHQVHGDHAVVVRSGSDASLAAVREEAAAGADICVCCAPDVPVLMCFADCVPVVVLAEGGFAIAHSGWRGTSLRVASKAVRLLAAETGEDPAGFAAYIGPHVGAEDYEVSPELAERFAAEFGPGAMPVPRHLDLGFCVRAALAEAGVAANNIAEVEDSTASNTDRFFSYRAEDGKTGRHGAIAFMRGNVVRGEACPASGESAAGPGFSAPLAQDGARKGGAA